MLTRAWSNNFFLNKKILFYFLSVLILSSCDFISNKILTKPVVQVNSLQLTAQEFSKELAIKLKDFDALSAKDPKFLSVFKKQIINDFIITSLIELWFKENSMSLSQEEIDKEVKSMLSAYPSDSVFRELLSESQISYSDWVTKVEAGLKKKMLIASLNKNAPKISESELLSYYNSFRNKYEQRESILLSHILVSDDNQAMIVKKLANKQNFTEIAKKYSSAFNLESKDVYGWVERGFSSDLEKVFKLPIGSVFGPVKLSDGIHLFKLLEKKPFKIISFAEARPRVLSEVMALRETARFTAWLDVQIKRYKIKKNINMINSIRVETR